MVRSLLHGLLGLMALPAAALAATPSAPPPPNWLQVQSAQCEAAISAAETKYGLPHALLGSIAKVESGRPITGMGDIRAWPWTINADGTGLFLDSKAAAIAWVNHAQATGQHHFIDVGCMQVDLPMHPTAFHNLDEAFDPVINADYAARYLRSLQTEAKGDWNVAVGLYHSHTPDLAADYRNRVAAVGAGILTGIGGPEPLYARAIRQGNLRLALAGGGILQINVRRQPRLRPQRVMSRCQIAAVLNPLLARKVTGCGQRG
ncbi:transglycosylase SLT domain-containing protein [Acidisphaera sp. L21]|uniref:transglycosylase SLT domain-containing protein n=1 Tax=Acidisphaera sp. L21 TaxID=1641851 RepID=UPI00131D81A8|nr:transglycosylase SLT domain-containing protein [Acidisphaera sp. L21]